MTQANEIVRMTNEEYNSLKWEDVEGKTFNLKQMPENVEKNIREEWESWTKDAGKVFNNSTKLYVYHPQLRLRVYAQRKGNARLGQIQYWEIRYEKYNWKFIYDKFFCRPVAEARIIRYFKIKDVGGEIIEIPSSVYEGKEEVKRIIAQISWVREVMDNNNIKHK